jgi:hypothetical protein
MFEARRETATAVFPTGELRLGTRHHVALRADLPHWILSQPVPTGGFEVGEMELREQR